MALPQSISINLNNAIVFMNVIHGAWIPKNIQDFIQSGDFYLWVESDEVRNNSKTSHHQQHLSEKPCLEFLKKELALNQLSLRQGVLLFTLEG